ncbi:hypothetical protein [Pleionea mediterranea]|uniref:hypothetical protein n=1 Tax=Pleionea mediterranea TaxID=523701 RepID=UPI0014754F24|nr:hypothetical protein [Pleionea mediterranea]
MKYIETTVLALICQPHQIELILASITIAKAQSLKQNADFQVTNLMVVIIVQMLVMQDKE